MGKLTVNCLMIVAACFLLNADAQPTPIYSLSIIGREATQSSGALPDAQNAVDGDLDTYQHTAVSGDPHPWWQVDLGRYYCMGRVTVYLRKDCCAQFSSYRHVGALVRAGTSPYFADNPPCGVPATREQSGTGAKVESLCEEPRKARYVSLDIDKSQPGIDSAILHVAEVEVEVYPHSQCVDMFNAANFAKLQEGGVIANSVPLSYNEASHVAWCAVHCMHTAGCVCFVYAPSSRQCRLHSIDATAIESTPNNDFSIYIMV